MTEKTSHKGKGQAAGNVNRKCMLILYNDNINSFDHVIRSLVEVCGHDEIQAEQCAVITHFRGKCDIRSGNRKFLSGMMNSLTERNLTVEIE